MHLRAPGTAEKEFDTPEVRKFVLEFLKGVSAKK
jgi:hypothetical protein